MRKVAIIAMAGVTLGMGLPYAINGQWWGLIACLLAGAIWVYPSPYRANQRSTLCISILAIVSGFGIFLGQPQMWLLTNFVLLLIAWDLDHYTRIYQEFEKDQTSENTASDLFAAHFKRLGLLAGLGWCLGIFALNIRIQLSFSVALLVIFLMIYGLRQVTRNFTQG